MNSTSETVNLESDVPDELEIEIPSDDNGSCDDNILASKPQSDEESQSYLILDNDADKENVNVGDYVTWVISVKNKGPDIAKNVKVLDKLPKGLKYIKHTATKGSFSPKTKIWNISNLSVDDGEVLLNIVTKALTSGEKINTAKLTTDSNNLNDAESFESEEIDVFENPAVSRSVSKSDSKEVHAAMMHPTANPIALVLVSFFGIFVPSFKRFRNWKFH